MNLGDTIQPRTTGTWKPSGRNVIVCLNSQDHRRQHKAGHAEVGAQRAGERNSSGGSARTGRRETGGMLVLGDWIRFGEGKRT